MKTPRKLSSKTNVNIRKKDKNSRELIWAVKYLTDKDIIESNNSKSCLK